MLKRYLTLELIHEPLLASSMVSRPEHAPTRARLLRLSSRWKAVKLAGGVEKPATSQAHAPEVAGDGAAADVHTLGTQFEGDPVP